MLESLLITLIVVLIIGAIVYWIISILPLPPIFKTAGYAILGLILLLYLLTKVGLP